MINKFEFSPAQGFLDTGAFPNPQGEDVTREQLQRLHTQTREFINALIDTINAYNIENKVTSETVKYLRVANGIIEWSPDNDTWYPLGGGVSGGSTVPGGGVPGYVLVRGDQEYTAKWADIRSAISVASVLKSGLMSAEDKALVDALNFLTSGGQFISAADVTETEMRSFLKNNERAQLFDNEGGALFYSATEAEQVFQHKIEYGYTLPEAASDGDIFLLLKGE